MFDRNSKKEEKLILSSAENLYNQIRNLESSYSFISDNLLADACVYELLAKKSRFRYIERLAKERNLNLSFSIKE